jgi:putative ABC transport system ATP-binding protein
MTIARTPGAPLLRAVDVVKTFERGPSAVPVLRSVSLAIRPGELVLLMGPSGSGKTTLLSILAALLRPTSGTVELDGEPISTLDDATAAAVRRKKLGFVFQTYNLFPALTALDNVALVHRMHGLSKSEARARAAEALDRVELSHRAHELPERMSSGQKQRVAIARALAGDPPLVLGDEPTAALDTQSAMNVMELLRAAVTPRSAVLLVTHDRRLERFAHRTLAMEDGCIVEERVHGDVAPGHEPQDAA